MYKNQQKKNDVPEIVKIRNATLNDEEEKLM